MTDLAAVNPDKYAVPKSEVVSAERTSLRRMPKIEDRLADETVCYEPLSDGKFPVKQGKYREFLPFSAFFGQKPRKKR
jgi:hypothetical protein